jgi:hypothetical protein
MFKDYLSKNGNWYTFDGLNLYKREELSIRFNTFIKTKKISVQILDNTDMEYNLRRILALYGLTLEEFEIDEVDRLILDYIIPVNFSVIDKDIPKANSKNKKSNEEEDEDRQKLLSRLISSVWAICENAGDAVYLIDKMPAEILLEVIKNRSEDLEKMYMSKEDRQKKEQKRIKDDLINKSKKNLKEV